MTDLETLDAAIQDIAANGFASVSAAGQTVTVKSIDELLKWREHLKGSEIVARSDMGIRRFAVTPVYP